jgi:hypothetical protein
MLSVLFPIVSVYLSDVSKVVVAVDDVNFVPSNTKDSPKTAPSCVYFNRVNK